MYIRTGERKASDKTLGENYPGQKGTLCYLMVKGGPPTRKTEEPQVYIQQASEMSPKSNPLIKSKEKISNLTLGVADFNIPLELPVQPLNEIGRHGTQWH